MEPHTKTYNGFSGVDIKTSNGITIQAFSYRLFPSVGPPHQLMVAGTIIFGDDCKDLPKVFNIELTGRDDLKRTMKKYIRGCELIANGKLVEALPETQYTFIAESLDNWSTIEPHKGK